MDIARWGKQLLQIAEEADECEDADDMNDLQHQAIAAYDNLRSDMSYKQYKLREQEG